MSFHTRSCGYRALDPDSIDTLSLQECNDLVARFSRGMAHPVRVEIIRHLGHKPESDRCLCRDIVDILPLAQSSVSQHLRVLKETGWIYGEIDGPRVCYCITDGAMEFYHKLLKRSMK